MAFLKVKVANANSVLIGDTAIILGKSGFATTFGSIPLLCTRKEYIGADEQIALTIRGLNNLIDLNFNQHILDVKTNSFSTHQDFMRHYLKGDDYLQIPIKQNSDKQRNFPGYINDGSDQITLNIATYYLNNNTIRVDSSNSQVINDILDTPMFVTLKQLIDTRFTSNNSIYIEGTKETIISEYSLVGNLLMSKTYALNGRCDNKEFIRVYKDGIEVNQSSYTLNPNNTVTINNLLISDTNLRIEHDHYTVPVVESGDNLYIQHANIYAVANVSYDPSSPTYNVALTSNQIFRVDLFYSLTANVGGLLATNITSDIEGTVTEIDSNGVANITYNIDSYPGKINLANNNVYTIITNGIYEPIFFGGSVKTIENAPAGLNSIKAVSVNPMGFISPTVTKSVNIRPIPIQKVTDLDIIESLYIDKTKGVISRATVSFTHIINQEITDYEISYKISGGSQFLVNGSQELDSLVSLETFSTVKVSASGIDSTGKIIYHINQLGSKIADSGVSLTVRVTPLNKNIRGSIAEKVISLVGKTASPQNVNSFSVGQNDNTLVMVWTLPRDSDGVLIDLDLAGVEIRRRNGVRTQDEFDLLYENAEFVASVSTEQSVAIIPITSYEAYTYLIKTLDTSGNKSITTKGYVFTPTIPNNLDVYQSYSEDAPQTPIQTGVDNTNVLEDDWPSANSMLNGNSNASINGFSELGPDEDFSDLGASGDAYYYTKIRDLGNNFTARVTVDWSGDVESGFTYISFKSNLTNEVSDAAPNLEILINSYTSNVLIDTTANGGSGIGDYVLYGLNANSNNFAYDNYLNKTLTNAAITSVTIARNHTGKILAVFNPGQFAGDGSNANSFALIAGVINANAIALGQAYYANSVPIKDSNGLLAWQPGANTAITNALPNISSSSYQIVDLQQFSDDNGSVRFLGGADIITTNVIIRYANVDPFSGMSAASIANGVCNTNVFYGANTVVEVLSNGQNAILRDGFGTHSATERNFRYFQIGLEAQNLDPSQGSFLLDQLRYQVYLAEKTIQISEANYSATPTTINFSSHISESFIRKPTVKITPISSTVPVIAQLAYVNTNNCGINLYYLANGVVANTADGFAFSLTAEGI